MTIGIERSGLEGDLPKGQMVDDGFVVPGTNTFGNTFRDYDVESERNKSVEQFYRMNHIYQSVEFVEKMMEEYGKLKRVEMSIWECIDLLNEYVDESDPDLDEPQIEHLLQTAEAIRKDYPNEDWLHLTALIHDLGKVLSIKVSSNYLSGQLWAIHSLWVVLLISLMFITSILSKIPTTTTLNTTPSLGFTSFPQYNTKFGIYSEGCGLDNVLMSWGHDDYMYLVAKENKTTLPSTSLFIIRYHSFYPLHKFGAYAHLMNEEDKKNLKWLHVFKKYDLYSKSKVRIEVEKYFPSKLRW